MRLPIFCYKGWCKFFSPFGVQTCTPPVLISLISSSILYTTQGNPLAILDIWCRDPDHHHHLLEYEWGSGGCLDGFCPTGYRLKECHRIRILFLRIRGFSRGIPKCRWMNEGWPNYRKLREELHPKNSLHFNMSPEKCGSLILGSLLDLCPPRAEV